MEMGTSVGLHQPESAAVPICWGIGSQTPSFTESLHLTPFYLVADATNLTVNQKLQVKKNLFVSPKRKEASHVMPQMTVTPNLKIGKPPGPKSSFCTS